jgi:hypothetical protein
MIVAAAEEETYFLCIPRMEASSEVWLVTPVRLAERQIYFSRGQSYHARVLGLVRPVHVDLFRQNPVILLRGFPEAVTPRLEIGGELTPAQAIVLWR